MGYIFVQITNKKVKLKPIDQIVHDKLADKINNFNGKHDTRLNVISIEKANQPGFKVIISGLNKLDDHQKSYLAIDLLSVKGDIDSIAKPVINHDEIIFHVGMNSSGKKHDFEWNHLSGELLLKVNLANLLKK